jgi:hypothetical protein
MSIVRASGEYHLLASFAPGGECMVACALASNIILEGIH